MPTPPKILALLVTLCLAASAPAQSKPVLLGAAWYPEQWPESRWDADLTLMEQAHFTVTRVGEFAWSRLEPAEGHYDLAWLDRAITLAAKHHIAVVIGTPTDAPPAWLTQKYPDTLGTNADGHVREHGGRRQFSYSSPHYRKFCVAIATQLARKFGHNLNVIGWQIGNEYTDESFDPATRQQFQSFLRTKYKTLDNLNDHWATSYWSQTYTDWSQIPLNNAAGNPGLMLEHRHFVTATWRSFQQVQIAAIRPLADPRQFITTNIGGLGWSDNWDHYAINEDLDLASWDDYVGTGHLNVVRNAFMNDFVRGWKRKNFWVMETEPGTVNWSPLNNALDPGETRSLAWQTIGHGADALLYWQWRSALNGQEQYHGGLVGPDGTPLPLYPEIQQLGEDLRKTAAALAGTTPVTDVALLVDYDSRWAIDFQPHTKNYDQLQVLLRFYQPLEQQKHTVDVINASANLDAYKLIVAPSLNVISKSLADHLLAYVRNGGHLLLGPRSGMKDEFNSLNPQRQPGPLTEALGAHVEQFYALDQSIALIGDGQHDRGQFNRNGSKADTWAEYLTTSSPDTVVDLTYGKGNGWLEGHPAMVTRTIGNGSMSYLGTLPDPALMQAIIKEALHSSGSWSYLGEIPDDIELCIRMSGDKRVYVLINHGTAPAMTTVYGRFQSLLSGPKITDTFLPTNASSTKIEIPPQGVAVMLLEPLR